MTRHLLVIVCAVAWFAGCDEPDKTKKVSTDNEPADNRNIHNSDGGINSHDGATDGHHQKVPPRMPAPSDTAFVADAANANLTEILLGKVALQKGKSEDVRKFGQQMIDDHTRAQDELKTAAKKVNVAVPADVDQEHQDVINKQSNLSGDEFDRAYIDLMVQDHEKVIAKFDDRARGDQNEVRDFAKSMMPRLRHHLHMAQALQIQIRDKM